MALHDIVAGARTRLLLAVCAAGVVTGCGGSAPARGSAAPSPSSAPPTRACAIELAVDGAEFTPQECVTGEVIPGPYCAPEDGCFHSGRIALRGGKAPGLAEVEVSWAGTSQGSINAGVRRLDPARGADGLNGYASDARHVGHALLRGEVAVQNTSHRDVLNVSIDLWFANHVHIRGHGDLRVLGEFNP